MAKCPRCGSTNQAGKALCWKCWAPVLPESPASPETPAPTTLQPAEVKRRLPALPFGKPHPPRAPEAPVVPSASSAAEVVSAPVETELPPVSEVETEPITEAIALLPALPSEADAPLLESLPPAPPSKVKFRLPSLPFPPIDLRRTPSSDAPDSPPSFAVESPPAPGEEPWEEPSAPPLAVIEPAAEVVEEPLISPAMADETPAPEPISEEIVEIAAAVIPPDDMVAHTEPKLRGIPALLAAFFRPPVGKMAPEQLAEAEPVALALEPEPVSAALENDPSPLPVEDVATAPGDQLVADEPVGADHLAEDEVIEAEEVPEAATVEAVAEETEAEVDDEPLLPLPVFTAVEVTDPDALEPADPLEAEDVVEEALIAEEHGGGWLIGVTVLLLLILFGAVAWWLHTLRPRHIAETPRDVTDTYLGALLTHDTGIQQQLATAASKGHFLPVWLTVTAAQLVGEVTPSGKTASATVALRLTPVPYKDIAPITYEAALAHPYRVTIALKQEAGVWRVDQSALFENLRYRVKVDNPALTMPAWK